MYLRYHKSRNLEVSYLISLAANRPPLIGPGGTLVYIGVGLVPPYASARNDTLPWRLLHA